MEYGGLPPLLREQLAAAPSDPGCRSGMTEIRIRRAEDRDILKILTIARASPESSQWSSQEYAHVIASAFESSNEECAVAEIENSVAGFIVTRTVADETEILNLAVAPARRRQGIATALVNHALAEARRAAAHKVFLEVRASNAAALAFYARHGFASSGHRRAYYSSPVDDAIILSLSLRPSTGH